MVVQLIEQRHRDEGLSYRHLCDQAGLAYGSVMRWRQRSRAGEPTVRRPGPAKTKPLDLDALRTQLRAMNHGRYRSAGTGDLYTRFADCISRRDLTALVREERQRQNREKDRVYHRVRWLVPRLVWAMDDTEYHPDKRYPKAYLHNVQDMGSRYKFEPLVGLNLARGVEVARHLSRLFSDHGPPLFIKRDNGGNLNHREVEELLCAAMVIPVNSPCYYPQYNGSMERAQNEIKSRLTEHEVRPSAFLAVEAELDVQALNHKKRADLRQRTPCMLFNSGRPTARLYNRRKRKEVYDWIREKMLEFAAKEGYDPDKAWRLAVETWLLDNRFITVSKKERCNPVL
jgi:hypothetical protein